MPLIKSKSKAARSKNIATEIKAGKKPSEAVAIGYAVQRRAGGKPGRTVTPVGNGAMVGRSSIRR